MADGPALGKLVHLGDTGASGATERHIATGFKAALLW
jgi:hypothetical protein